MSLFGVLATVYLAACTLLFASQRSLLYPGTSHNNIRDSQASCAALDTFLGGR